MLSGRLKPPAFPWLSRCTVVSPIRVKTRIGGSNGIWLRRRGRAAEVIAQHTRNSCGD